MRENFYERNLVRLSTTFLTPLSFFFFFVVSIESNPSLDLRLKCRSICIVYRRPHYVLKKSAQIAIARRIRGNIGRKEVQNMEEENEAHVPLPVEHFSSVDWITQLARLRQMEIDTRTTNEEKNSGSGSGGGKALHPFTSPDLSKERAKKEKRKNNSSRSSSSRSSSKVNESTINFLLPTEITKSLRIFEESNVDSTAHAMVYENEKGLWITQDATKVAREWLIAETKKKEEEEAEIGEE